MHGYQMLSKSSKNLPTSNSQTLPVKQFPAAMSTTTKYDSMFTMMNILLGTGPLILPSPYQQAGFALSTIWISIIGLISFTCAEFLVESLARINFIKEEKSKPIEERSLLSENDVVRKQDVEIREAIETGEMALIASGKKAEVFVTVILTLYMLGVVISKCIMTGNTLSTVFEGVAVLDSIYLWLAVFFVSGSVFSFGNIQQTKILQYAIIAIRFLSLLSMIGGAIYIIAAYGNQGLVPAGTSAFNFSYFPQLFSNTIFGLLCHHSLPSIIAPVRPAQGAKFSVRYGFLISIVTVLVIPFTGIMAFGTGLSQAHAGDLKLYNFNFEEKAPAVFYLVSFYMFLNVASMPVLTIVLRTNILKLLAPQVESHKLSKTTVITTGCILSVVLLVALLARDQIEYVLMFTGGICGVFILMIIPSFLLIKSRNQMPKIEGGFPYQATVTAKWVPYVIIVFGLCSLVFNLTETIIKLTK